jgi:hypothetical protein
MIRGTYRCNLSCCGIVILKGMIRFLYGWSLAARTRGIPVSSSPVSLLSVGNPQLRNNVDHTLAVLDAAAAPPSASILSSAIITQVCIVNRGHHASACSWFVDSCCSTLLCWRDPLLLSTKKQVPLPCDGPVRGIMKTGSSILRFDCCEVKATVGTGAGPPPRA